MGNSTHEPETTTVHMWEVVRESLIEERVLVVVTGTEFVDYIDTSTHDMITQQEMRQRHMFASKVEAMQYVLVHQRADLVYQSNEMERYCRILEEMLSSNPQAIGEMAGEQRATTLSALSRAGDRIAKLIQLLKS